MTLGYKDFDIYFHMANHYRKLKKVKSLIDFSQPKSFSRLANRSRSKSIQSLRYNSSRSSSKVSLTSPHLLNHSKGCTKHDCVMDMNKVSGASSNVKSCARSAQCIQANRPQTAINPLIKNNNMKIIECPNRRKLPNKSCTLEKENQNISKCFLEKQNQNRYCLGNSYKNDSGAKTPCNPNPDSRQKRCETQASNDTNASQNNGPNTKTQGLPQKRNDCGCNKSPRDMKCSAPKIDPSTNETPRDKKCGQKCGTGIEDPPRKRCNQADNNNRTCKCSVTDKNGPDSSSKANMEYMQFLLRVTEDILRNDLYTNKDMEAVFESHIEANKRILDEVKMREELDKLRTELDIPVGGIKYFCGAENGSFCSGKPRNIPLLENPDAVMRALTDKLNETPEQPLNEDLGESNDGHSQDCTCPSCQNARCFGFQNINLLMSEDTRIDDEAVAEDQQIMEESLAEASETEKSIEESPLLPVVEEENAPDSDSVLIGDEVVEDNDDDIVNADDDNNVEDQTCDQICDQTCDETCELRNSEVTNRDLSSEIPPAGYKDEGKQRYGNICGSTPFPYKNTGACNSIPIKEISPKEMTVVRKKADKGSDALDLCFCATPSKKPALKIQFDKEDEEGAYVLVEGNVCIPKNIYETSTVPVLLDNVSSSFTTNENEYVSAANLMIDSTASANKDPRKISISATVIPIDMKSRLLTNEYDLTPQRDLPSDKIYHYLMVDAATSFTKVGAKPFEPKNTLMLGPKIKRSTSSKDNQEQPRERQLSFTERAPERFVEDEDNNDLKVIMVPGMEFTSPSDKDIGAKEPSLLLRDEYRTIRRLSSPIKSELRTPVTSQTSFPQKSTEELIRRSTITSYPVKPGMHMPKSTNKSNKESQEKELADALDQFDEEEPSQYVDSDDWMVKLDYKPTIYSTPSTEKHIAEVTEKLRGFRTVEDDESSSLRHLYQKSAAEDKLPELEYESTTTGGFQSARSNQTSNAKTTKCFGSGRKKKK